MPRQPRKISDSGMYHVVMRGINRQTIFEDEEDCEKFLFLLLWYKEKCKYRIHAWCLMGNHIHLLIEIMGDPIDVVLKYIVTSYVYVPGVDGWFAMLSRILLKVRSGGEGLSF